MANENTGFHGVETYTGKNTAHSPQQRLCVINYKARTEKAADGSERKLPKFPSLCVSLPLLRVPTVSADHPAAVQINAATRSMYEALQDDLVRSLIDAKRSDSDPSKNNLLSIAEAQIDLAAIATFAASTGSGKLSGESIGNWFDSSATEPLMEALMRANPAITDDRVTQAVSNYRALMVKLAAVQPGLVQQQQTMLRKLLTLLPEDDVMSTRLIAKLDSMNKVVIADPLEMI